MSTTPVRTSGPGCFAASASTSRDSRRETSPLAASDVNAASISVGSLVGRQTITRSVTNVSASTERYTAEVTGLRGIARSVSPAVITLAPGQSARFAITLSAAQHARYDDFATGSLVWRATSGHTVVSPVVVRPELASTPREVTGSGRSGSATIDSLAGVTGTVHVRTPGLVAGSAVPLTLRPGTFDPQHPATSAATAVTTVSVQPGSRAARFEVTSSDTADDVDLYVYRDGVLVASASDRSGNETVTIPRPPEGSYRIYVTAHDAGEDGAAQATFTSWVLPHAAQDNLVMQQRAIGVSGGERFSATARWAGLDPRQRWWGYVALRGVPGVTYLTLN